ncbi:N(G),N(G)-dimethylarginine dimethylaminohydrolase [Xanthomonas sacchari]|uniref:Arginine deiminase-related protein n=1 Tax=Xanthomonas sacchari TaxID=56458 RepID=A0AA46Q8T3_9XANT|nr:arginine deiminase-related protein [Xanthomonas sacchari]MCW0366323.1 N(G),N(G)-dimethylarginine dimethylaminohydrolase [Xanthomonas sacchari]MCW0440652.1 N(G),N(G)-dimethylarginine dimethylaminohydrolase [Xanthomonas sacchari]UYK87321.1 arginine deiminase-related protein [Xanthomonas sacchari]
MIENALAVGLADETDLALASPEPQSRASASYRHRLLMCAPQHFAVDYVINPWMEGNVHAASRERAQAQWNALVSAAEAAGARVDCIAAAPGLPDMVFSANAGLVLGDRFVPSRFRHAERRGEEALFAAWCRQAGLRICELPEQVYFEGAGDALLDRGARRLWMGHGHRSDLAAAHELTDLLDIEVVPLRLVDARFYHLDTCFCPLRDGYLLYYPAAFDADAQQAIAQHIPASRRIAVGEADALAFACNAVDLDDTLLLNRASPALCAALAAIGYRVVQTPLDEFLKAGGAAKCLTLRLDE